MAKLKTHSGSKRDLKLLPGKVKEVGVIKSYIDEESTKGKTASKVGYIDITLI